MCEFETALTVEQVIAELRKLPTGSIMVNSNGAGYDSFRYSRMTITTYRLLRAMREDEPGYIPEVKNMCYDETDTRLRFMTHFSGT